MNYQWIPFQTFSFQTQHTRTLVPTPVIYFLEAGRKVKVLLWGTAVSQAQFSQRSQSMKSIPLLVWSLVFSVSHHIVTYHQLWLRPHHVLQLRRLCPSQEESVVLQKSDKPFAPSFVTALDFLLLPTKHTLLRESAPAHQYNLFCRSSL